MALDVEGIVYGGLDVQKSLDRAWGFESLLFALSPSDRLVRALRAIVRTLVIDVLSRQAEVSNRGMIGWALVACGAGFEQLAHQISETNGARFRRRCPIPVPPIDPLRLESSK